MIYFFEQWLFFENLGTVRIIGDIFCFITKMFDHFISPYEIYINWIVL